MIKADPGGMLKNYWPQMLWGGLLFALGANIIYLALPNTSEVFVITPHPAMSYVSLEQLPVLVEAPSSDYGKGEEQGYLLVEMASEKTKSTVSKKFHSQKIHNKTAFTGKVNLNKASLEQLQLLPGIGPKMAKRIMDYRKVHGTFKSLAQLMEIPGIGSKKLEKLIPYCTL